MTTPAKPNAQAPSDSFEWMRPFTSGPADLAKLARGKAQYAPPSRDPVLRRAQDEDALEDQIWLLAVEEAYASNNAGWFNAMHEKRVIVADYLRRHPAMERFQKTHIAAGTCAEAVEAILKEKERRRHGPDPEKPAQEQVNAWILDLYQTANLKGHPPPKRDTVLNDCRADIRATEEQMREAIKRVPNDLKRARGGRDRT